jgi:hypothetical protein
MAGMAQMKDFKSEWISGKELIGAHQWKIARGFELLELVQRGLLQPHDPITGDPVPSPDTYKKESKLYELEKKLEALNSDLKYALSPETKLASLIPPSYGAGRRSSPGITMPIPKPDKTRVKRELKETKAEIASLKKELTPPRVFSWIGYLPDSRNEKLRAIDILLKSIYKLEELIKVGLNQEKGQPDHSNEEFPPEIQDLIEKALPQIDKIIGAIKKYVGWTNQDYDANEQGPIEDKWKEEALDCFDDNKDEFSIITREHLEEIDYYSLAKTNQSRDFRNKLLQIIITDLFPNAQIYGRDRLYKICKKFSTNLDLPRPD